MIHGLWKLVTGKWKHTSSPDLIVPNSYEIPDIYLSDEQMKL